MPKLLRNCPWGVLGWVVAATAAFLPRRGERRLRWSSTHRVPPLSSTVAPVTPTAFSILAFQMRRSASLGVQPVLASWVARDRTRFCLIVTLPSQCLLGFSLWRQGWLASVMMSGQRYVPSSGCTAPLCLLCQWVSPLFGWGAADLLSQVALR